MAEMDWEEWYDRLTVDTILRWIIEHREDTKSIDAINKTAFPFSSKFAKKANYSNQDNNGGA